MEGRSTEFKVSLFEFQRSTSTSADQNFTKVSTVTADAGHGEKTCVPDESSPFWQSQALPGLVPTAVSSHARISVVKMRSHSVHRRSHTSDERAAMFRHHTTMGGDRLAVHHVHLHRGGQQRKAGSLLRLAVLRAGQGQHHEHRAGDPRHAQLDEVSSTCHCHTFRFFMQGTFIRNIYHDDALVPPRDFTESSRDSTTSLTHDLFADNTELLSSVNGQSEKRDIFIATANFRETRLT